MSSCQGLHRSKQGLGGADTAWTLPGSEVRSDLSEDASGGCTGTRGGQKWVANGHLRRDTTWVGKCWDSHAVTTCACVPKSREWQVGLVGTLLTKLLLALF